jgi:hypothetical protein
MVKAIFIDTKAQKATVVQVSRYMDLIKHLKGWCMMMVCEIENGDRVYAIDLDIEPNPTVCTGLHITGHSVSGNAIIAHSDEFGALDDVQTDLATVLAATTFFTIDSE